MKTKIIMTLVTVALIALVVIVSLTDNHEDHEIINIEDIVFEEGVVNIYYFWRVGCPHCDAQFQFFEKIAEEWGAYFNLYSFEVSYNEDHARLLTDVAEILDERVAGIPFTIIGEQVFIGFNERMENNFIEAIRDGVNQDFDVFRGLIEQ